MNELRLPSDTPIQYEEGLWELCTDRAYEMMQHKKQFLDDDTFNIRLNTGLQKSTKQTHISEGRIDEIQCNLHRVRS